MTTLHRGHASRPCDPSHVVDQLHLRVSPDRIALLEGEMGGFLGALDVLKLHCGCLFFRVTIDSDYFAKVLKVGVDLNIVEFILRHILDVNGEATGVNHALRLGRLSNLVAVVSWGAHVAAGLGCHRRVRSLLVQHARVGSLLETTLRTHIVLLATIVIIVLEVVSGPRLAIVASHHLVILALIVVELSVSTAHMTSATVIFVEVAATATHVTTSSTPTLVITTTTKAWLLETAPATSATFTVKAASAAFTVAHVTLVVVTLMTTPLLVALLRGLLWCLHLLVGDGDLVIAELEQVHLLIDPSGGLLELRL